MEHKIISFSGEYRFLSNFWPVDVIGPGNAVYPSVEHAYMAYKTNDQESWNKILTMTPGQAKRFGRTLEIRKDWNKIRLPVMTNLLEQKFSNSELFHMLKQTGDAELIEGNTWGDTFWGQCPIGNGENNLGKILMQIRDGIF